MATYLLTWTDPGLSERKFDGWRKTVAQRGFVKVDYKCRSQKPTKGDRVFLLHQREAHGVVAAGAVVGTNSAVFGGEERVPVHFTEMLALADRLDVRAIDELNGGPWSTRASGIRVPDDVAALLEKRWAAWRASRDATTSQQRRTWIVKGKPSRQDLREMICAGVRDEWETARPPREWREGDALIFWEAAPTTRVVGLGRLGWLSKRPDDEGQFRFEVRYESDYLEGGHTIDELRMLPIFDGATFLKRGPSGVLFPLTQEQARTLSRLIDERHGAGASASAQANPTTAPSVTTSHDDEDDLGMPEGEVREGYVRHRSRERALRERVLREWRQRNGGQLICAVPRCAFDFEKVYGSIGDGFAEVHHLEPLASRKAPSETKPSELVVVCANCHRMIHRGGTCRELTTLIATPTKQSSTSLTSAALDSRR